MSSQAACKGDFIKLLGKVNKECGALYMNSHIRDDPSLAAKVSKLTPTQLND